MLNTMLLGQKLSFIQIISPMISAFLLSIRAVDVAKPGDDDEIADKVKTRNVVYSNILISYSFLLGSFMMVLACYDYSDTRAPWAK